jgi:hypothetical protein
VLNSAEKRFIRYWEEQRTGGKLKYYLLYMLTGTFISTLVLSFLYVLVISKNMALDWTVVPIILVSFILIIIITIATWESNEKKFKAIIKREVREGQLLDNGKDKEKSVQE